MRWILRSVKALVQLCNTSTNLAGRVEASSFMWPPKTGYAQSFLSWFLDLTCFRDSGVTGAAEKKVLLRSELQA